MSIEEEIDALVDEEREQGEALQITGPPVRVLNEFFSFKYGWQKIETLVQTADGLQNVEFETFVVLNIADGSEYRFYFTDADKAELLAKMTRTAEPVEGNEGE